MAEKSRPCQGVRQRQRYTPDGSSTSETHTTSGTAACSGMRSTRLDNGRPYIYVLYTYDAAIGGPRRCSARRADRATRAAPMPRRGVGCAGHQRYASPHHAQRQLRCRQRAGARRRRGASSSRATRSAPCVRRRRLSLSRRRRRGRLPFPTTVRRRSYPTCQDPVNEQKSRRGGRSAQDLRTTGDPSVLNGTSSASTPTPARRPPATRTATPTLPDHRVRHAQPVPPHLPPGYERVWIGDVGCRGGTRSTVSSIPTARVENFGWPCMEGAPATRWRPGTGSSTTTCAPTAQRRGGRTPPAPRTRRHLPTVTPGPTSPTSTRSAIPSTPSTAEAGSRRRSPVSPSTREGSLPGRPTTGICSWPTTPGSASGRCCRAHDGVPNRDSIVTVVSERLPGGPRPRSPGATSSSPISHAWLRRPDLLREHGPTRRRWPSSVPTVSPRPCGSPSTFDGLGLRSTPTATPSPTRGTSTGNGGSATPAGRTADRHLHRSPMRRRRGSTSSTPTATTTSTTVDHPARPAGAPVATIDTPAAGPPLVSRVADRVQRHRGPTATTVPSPTPTYSWQVVMHHCLARARRAARGLPRALRVQPRGRHVGRHHRSRPRRPLRAGAPPHGDRQRRAHSHRVAADRPRHRAHHRRHGPVRARRHRRRACGVAAPPTSSRPWSGRALSSRRRRRSTGAGSTLAFDGWSDGASRSHVVSVPHTRR